MDLFASLALPREDQAGASLGSTGRRVKRHLERSIKGAVAAIVIYFAMPHRLGRCDQRAKLVRRFAQQKASRLAVPRHLLAADTGRPHQVQRWPKASLYPKVTPTLDREPDKDTRIRSVRRDPLAHPKVRRRVNARHPKRIHLDRGEYPERGLGSRVGHLEAQLISLHKLQGKAPELETVFTVPAGKAAHTMCRDIPVRLRARCGPNARLNLRPHLRRGRNTIPRLRRVDAAE